MDIGAIWNVFTNMIAPTRVHYLVLIVYVIALSALMQSGTVTQSAILDLTAWVFILLFFMGPIQRVASGSTSDNEQEKDEEKQDE